MLRILDRYLLREIVPSLFLGIGVFTFVLLLNQILHYAQILITQRVNASIALGILFNLLPSVLCLTIPMGLLLGILIALGRLAADSEITAMRASGVSLYRLLTPLAVAAILAWVVSSYLIIQVLPDSNQRTRELLFQAMTSQAGKQIRPRVFYDRLFPNMMFLVREIPADNQRWQEVIMADLTQPESPTLTFADEGQLVIDSDERTASFYLKNAEIHRVAYSTPDDYQHRIDSEVSLPLPTETLFPPEDINVPRGARELHLAELARQFGETGLPKYSTEIHKKFSFPFACFVFGVLGLALGIHNRRDGRSWGFVVSIGIIFVYYLMITIGERLAANGRLSPVVGMWTANVVLGALGAALLVRNAREGQGAFWSWDEIRSAAARLNLRSLGNWLSGLRRAQRTKARQGRATSTDRGMHPSETRTVVVLKIPRLRLSPQDIRFPNTLDRYVTANFVRNFLLILSALVTVYVLGVLIDIFPFVFENRIKGKVLFQYLAAVQPEIFFHMLPLSTLMATLVCFALLSKTSELTAVKAGGISMYRTAMPVILAGVLVSGACFAIQEYVLPFANRRAVELKDEIEQRPVQTHNILNRQWMLGEQQQIYHYAYYDSTRRVFSGLAVYRFGVDPFRLTERFYAQTARWTAAEGGWLLANGWSRNFLTGRRHERFDKLLIPDMEPPSYFAKEERRSEQMTYFELSDYISDLEQSGFDVVRLQVAKHAKFSFPLAAVVTVLIGIPFSFTPGKKGALYGIGIAIAIGLSYYVITRMFGFMGETAMLPPLMAAWSPNVLFAVAALYGLFNVRT